MNVAATDWNQNHNAQQSIRQINAVFCDHHKPASDTQYKGELQALKQTY